MTNRGNWNGPLALIVLVIVGSIACERGERHYTKRADLGNDIERGWIPTWLTSDATEIRYLYDLDTNDNCGVFTFSAKGAAELIAACQDAELVENRLPDERPAMWWPSELTRGHALGSKFRFVVCKGPPRNGETASASPDDYAAIDPLASKAYFWWLPG